MSGERLYRVDPRLVHATMMNVWVPTTGARTLLVCDGELAADVTKRAIQEMSAMGLVAVRFCAEADATRALAALDPVAPAIVLFSSLESVARSVEAGLEIDRLNIGHVPEASFRTEVHPAVHLGPPDFEIIDALQTRGLEVFIQPLPNDKTIVVPKPKSTSAPAPAAPSKISDKLRVLNDRGLHLRAAHVLAHLSGRLPCKVTIGYNGHSVNAKSLLGLTTLGATCGTELEVICDGSDAQSSLQKIRELFATGFNEGVDWVGEETA